MPVERRELQPLVQVFERVVVGNAAREVLEHGRMAGPESPPLRGEPAVEDRAAGDLQALQKIAIDQCGERAQSFRRERFDALPGRTGNLDGIDEGIRQVELNGVPAGGDAPGPALVHDAPDLAQAPAELSPRIVGNIPQQLAQSAPRHGMRRKGEVGQERAHLARSRQRQCAAVPADRDGPEQAHLERRRTARQARATGFHGIFHARYHARVDALTVQCQAIVAARDGWGREIPLPNESRSVMDIAVVTKDQNRPSADLKALKARQQTAWASGNYALIGTTLQIVGEELCEALDLRSGQKVLDVAAGNGNASLAAARRWCEVVATDYVPALLDRARERAAGERLDIAFREADAEALPFPDGGFDAIVSTFGVMFTPDQDRAAAEMVRVCRRGGRIGLASWTPEGFIGQLFKTIGKHLPPPPGVMSPALWGTRVRMSELFERHAASIKSGQRNFVFRYRSPAHWLDVFKTYYGPVLKAFAALDAGGQGALQRDLLALIDQFNRAEDGTMVVPSEYLEVVITRE